MALDLPSAWDGTTRYASSGEITQSLNLPTTAAPSISRPLSPPVPSFLDDLLSRGGITTPLDLALSIPAAVSTQQQGILLPPGSDADPLDDPGPIIPGNAYQPRGEYVGRRLAAQPSALAQRGLTTFIHHTQVGASAALQDALAASALHCIRGASNAAMVRQEIARRASMLIRAVDLILASADTPQPIEIDLLPPVQALLIYQCIRLFSSDDLAQQAQAERDGVTLLTWARRLQKQLQPICTDHGRTWAEWIREESARRAVVTAELLAAIYRFLKLGWDRTHVRMALLGFTAQAALWEARSAAEWKAALATSTELPVTLASFTEDIVGATQDDVEDLGIIIYALQNGLDGLEEWLGGDKAVLRKWALRP
ncbi:hypothetical protein GQ53DRAFT_742617 [Thozetella sp. PMI_491]|nr:hypothetical protein GQ53DRAFT_742617 [Thozetella sp. PMI_491]